MKIITTLMRGMMRQGTDIRILVRNNNVDSALRVLKRKTKDKLVELKDKAYHEKRSEKRHRMLQSAKVREHKRQKDENKTKRRRH
mgnify:FL=1